MKTLLVTCCLLVSITSYGQKKKALEKSNPAVDTLRKAVEVLKGDFNDFQKMYAEKSKRDSLTHVTTAQETKLATNDKRFQFHDLIGIYAAIVSTIVGLVQISKYVREVRDKLVVRFFIGSQAIHYGNSIGEWTPVFTVNVVN